jgi:hypothetical protein
MGMDGAFCKNAHNGAKVGKNSQMSRLEKYGT